MHHRGLPVGFTSFTIIFECAECTLRDPPQSEKPKYIKQLQCLRPTGSNSNNIRKQQKQQQQQGISTCTTPVCFATFVFNHFRMNSIRQASEHERQHVVCLELENKTIFCLALETTNPKSKDPNDNMFFVSNSRQTTCCLSRSTCEYLSGRQRVQPLLCPVASVAFWLIKFSTDEIAPNKNALA